MKNMPETQEMMNRTPRYEVRYKPYGPPHWHVWDMENDCNHSYHYTSEQADYVAKQLNEFPFQGGEVINTLGVRKNAMNAALVYLFSHTSNEVAKDLNNKVLAFVCQLERELKTTKDELAAFKKNNLEFIAAHNSAVAERDQYFRTLIGAMYAGKFDDLGVKELRTAYEEHQRDLLAFREDKELLDWVETLGVGEIARLLDKCWDHTGRVRFRQTLNAARKEAQP